MNLSTAIEAWLEARKAEGYSPNTLRNNRKDMSRVLNTLGDMPLRSLNAQHIDRVMADVADVLSPGAINNLLAAISGFSKWCRARGHMAPDQDPVGGRRYRKTMRPEKRRIPLAQFPALLDAAPHPRDRATIALGLYLLLRASEIADLRIGDVDLASGEISVRVFKTHDRDVMPISAELDRELRSWLTRYAEEVGPLTHEMYLVPALRPQGFHIQDGRRLRREDALAPNQPQTTIKDTVQRALQAIGYPTRRQDGKSTWDGAHTLRRSAARAMFDELVSGGYDGALRMVQAYLHHSSVVMTERYIGIEQDRNKRNRLFSGNALYPSLASVTGFPKVVRHGEDDRAAV